MLQLTSAVTTHASITAVGRCWVQRGARGRPSGYTVYSRNCNTVLCGTGYLGSCSAVIGPRVFPYKNSVDFKQGAHWMLTGTGNEWCYNWNLFCFPCCHQSSTATRCHLHIKAGAFTTCRKVTENASKWTNIVCLWQPSERQGFSSEWHHVCLERDARWVIETNKDAFRYWMYLCHFHCTALWLREGSLGKPDSTTHLPVSSLVHTVPYT